MNAMRLLPIAFLLSLFLSWSSTAEAQVVDEEPKLRVPCLGPDVGVRVERCVPRGRRDLGGSDDLQLGSRIVVARHCVFRWHVRRG